MKKLIAAILIAVSILPLASCGSSGCARCGDTPAKEKCPVCGSYLCDDCWSEGIDYCLWLLADYDYVKQWCDDNGYILVER